GKRRHGGALHGGGAGRADLRHEGQELARSAAGRQFSTYILAQACAEQAQAITVSGKGVQRRLVVGLLLGKEVEEAFVRRLLPAKATCRQNPFAVAIPQASARFQ